MKIKPHKNKTVSKIPKIDFKSIDYKRLVPKIIVAIVLVAVVGMGVYGTIYGIKEEIRDKEIQENVTTTKAPVIKMEGKEKAFTENGVKITLTDKFEIKKDSAVDAGFVAEGIEIYFFNETFEEYPEDKDLTVEEYLKDLAEINGEDPESIKEEDGLYYFEYMYDSGKKLDAYVVTAYKHTDGFFIANFITSNSDAIAFKEHIMKWAKTVEIVE